MSDATDAQILSMMHEALERLTKIEISLAVQSEALKSHTVADSENFERLSTSLTRLTNELDVVQLARAREAGEKDAASSSPTVSSIVKWGAGVGAALAAIAEAVRTFLMTGKH